MMRSLFARSEEPVVAYYRYLEQEIALVREAIAARGGSEIGDADPHGGQHRILLRRRGGGHWWEFFEIA